MDFFDTFQQFGFDVNVVQFDVESDELISFGEPGYEWTKNMKSYENGKFFHVHKSDIVRMLILQREGGTYLDMDHITMRPILGLEGPGENVFGAEICLDHGNKDCFSASALLELGVIRPDLVDNPLENPGRSGFRTAAVMDRKSPTPGFERYTPCNGVMINWAPRHPMIAAALQHADSHYDPACWGCLGPRLFGLVLMHYYSFPTAALPIGSIELLPPGALYPVDYKHISAVLGGADSEAEDYIQKHDPYGIHFYGKVTTTVAIQRDSTMDKIIASSTIFGADPQFRITRSAGGDLPFCVASEFT